MVVFRFIDAYENKRGIIFKEDIFYYFIYQEIVNPREAHLYKKVICGFYTVWNIRIV